MSRRSIQLNDALYDYLLKNSLRESEVMRRLREESPWKGSSGMQISPDQGQFMALLIEMIGARRCIEIGTYTGYSALCVARALPDDGLLIACDINEETTGIARQFWQEAGVADKIDLRIAPALKTLEGLLAEGADGSFDFVFIDADKESYDAYYERALELLRPGGIVAVDNVLWHGSVINASANDPETLAIRALNAKIASDQRVSCSMLPLGDGLTLARKQTFQAV